MWDAVAFHAQQCAEKYLKAFLEEQGVPFTKSHNLLKTLDLSQGLLAELDGSRTQLTHLSVFGIAVRYPSVQADQEAAEQAVRIAGQVRNVVRAKLGLP